MVWGWNPSPLKEGTHSSNTVKQLSQSICWRCREMDAGVPWRLPSFLFISVSTLHPWDSSTCIQDGSSLPSWSSLQTPSLTHPEMCSMVTPKPIKLTMRNNCGMNSLWNMLWDSIKMKCRQTGYTYPKRQLSTIGTWESLRSCHETLLWPAHASPLKDSILKLKPQGDDIKRWHHREIDDWVSGPILTWTRSSF